MDGTGLAKIILIGEHSVVYGHPAIAIPFYALRSDVKLTSAPTFTLKTKYYEGELQFANAPMLGLKALIDEMIIRYKLTKPVEIYVQSNIPERSGLGSSASVAKSIIDAFNNYYKLGLSKDDYLDLIKVSENIYHQKASGIDAFTIVHETPLFYQKQLFKPLRSKIDAYLMVIYSNTNSATRDAVIHVSNHPNRDEHINKLAVYTYEAEQALHGNDVKRLGVLFNKAHNELSALGLSTPILDELRTKALSAGALGVKLTGGGMGGCLIALFDSKDTAQAASNALSAYKTWIVDMRKI